MRGFPSQGKCVSCCWQSVLLIKVLLGFVDVHWITNGMFLSAALQCLCWARLERLPDLSRLVEKGNSNLGRSWESECQCGMCPSTCNYIALSKSLRVTGGLLKCDSRVLFFFVALTLLRRTARKSITISMSSSMPRGVCSMFVLIQKMQKATALIEHSAVALCCKVCSHPACRSLRFQTTMRRAAPTAMIIGGNPNHDLSVKHWATWQLVTICKLSVTVS